VLFWAELEACTSHIFNAENTEGKIKEMAQLEPKKLCEELKASFDLNFANNASTSGYQ
jgi:hypothetical protein